MDFHLRPRVYSFSEDHRSPAKIENVYFSWRSRGEEMVDLKRLYKAMSWKKGKELSKNIHITPFSLLTLFINSSSVMEVVSYSIHSCLSSSVCSTVVYFCAMFSNFLAKCLENLDYKKRITYFKAQKYIDLPVFPSPLKFVPLWLFNRCPLVHSPLLIISVSHTYLTSSLPFCVYVLFRV
jgi:hypothetical protein